MFYISSLFVPSLDIVLPFEGKQPQPSLYADDDVHNRYIDVENTLTIFQIDFARYDGDSIVIIEIFCSVYNIRRRRRW